MAVITGSPYITKSAVLTIGTDEYTFLVKKAEAIPTTPKTRHNGIGGSSVPMLGQTTWVLEVEFSQDWITTTSLSNLAFDAAGQSKDFTIKPTTNAAVKGFKGAILIEPGNIGGAAQSEATSTISFEVVGDVTRITT